MAGSSVAIALTSGTLAAFNPCGFAMLPAYLASFVTTDQADRPLASRIMRAVRVGASVTAGFLAVFSVIGFAFQGLGSFSKTVLPILTFVIGLALVVLGIAMLFGYEPKFALPRLNTDSSAKDTKAMFLYGVSYAVVSLGCTLPIFILQVVSSLQRKGIASGLLNYAAYAAGMGLVVITLTVAVALGQQGFIKNMRKVLPFINRAAAVLLVLAGAYVAYYGAFEWQQEHSDRVRGGGLADWMFTQNGNVLTWLQGHSNLLAIVAVALIGTIAAAVVLRPKAALHTNSQTKPSTTSKGAAS
jgi:cytochrome c-type biogenesis protein